MAMDTMLWLVFGAVILLGVIAIGLVIYRRKIGLKQETDYRTFFIMGIMWTALGFIPDMRFFLPIGIIFMIIGLIHKKEWKEPKPWEKLSAKEKAYKKLVMIILGILVLLGLVLFLVGYYIN